MDRLSQCLQRNRVNATAIHGDLSQSEREEALSRFKRKFVRVLVATARQLSAGTLFFQIERAAFLHSYGPDPHSRAVALCNFL